MSNENGRTSTEILAVLAIAGLLSVGGLMGYSHIMNNLHIDNILETLQQRIFDIHSNAATQKFSDPNALNAYLKQFTTTVGNYKISFHAAPEKDGSFIS